MKTMLKTLFIAMVVLTAASFETGLAGDGGECDRCGHGGGRKVCRLVCEKKTIELPCYSSKCETFCVGGPCKMGCKHGDGLHGSGCCGDKECASCQTAKRFGYQETIPGCPKQFTRKVLLRKKVKKEVTVYRWVVEDLCKGCEEKAASTPVPADASLPTRPRVDAVVLRPRVASTVSLEPTPVKREDSGIVRRSVR